MAISDNRPGALHPCSVRCISSRRWWTAPICFRVFDQFVGFGDTLTASRFSVLFARHGLGVRLRLASRLEFPDVRDSATVLIGACTNRSTMGVAQGSAVSFAMCGSRPCVSEPATGKAWTLTGKSDDGNSPGTIP